VSQFIAQETKVNPCKFETTKDDITSFVMPNNTHLAPFVDLILTLIWDLLVKIGPNHMDYSTKP